MPLPASISIVTRDSNFATYAKSALSAPGIEPRVYSSLRLWPVSAANSLLVLDADLLNETGAPDIEALVRDGLACIGLTLDDDETIRFLAEKSFLNCFVARNHEFAPGVLTELATAVNAREGRGMERFLAPGTRMLVERLSQRGDQQACLGRIQKDLAAYVTFPEFPEIVTSAIGEMVSNALIDAPTVKADGVTARRSAVAAITYGCDGKHLAVEVTDPWGSLSRDKIAEAISRAHRQGPDQIRSGTGGAGIGLYLMFNCATDLQFVVRPGEHTVVTLVAKVEKRFKTFSKGGRILQVVNEG